MRKNPLSQRKRADPDTQFVEGVSPSLSLLSVVHVVAKCCTAALANFPVAGW